MTDVAVVMAKRYAGPPLVQGVALALEDYGQAELIGPGDDRTTAKMP